MIPASTREKIEEAMRQFDGELRDTPEWRGWEENEAHKYAIHFERRHYPVKKVVSLATGSDVGLFSGGDEANSYVINLGFNVSLLRGEGQV
jgi:5-methylcytosine-specific restriction protein A